jgi:rhodanese-related sulfurtransferase
MGQQQAVISATQLNQWLQDGNELAIVDAREEDTFATAHLLLASCLALSRLEQIAPRLLPRRNLRIVVCDAGGGLAQRAADRLCAAGYTDVSVLSGGIEAWRHAGFPIYSGVHVPSKAFAEYVEHEGGTPAVTPADLAVRIAASDDLVILDSRSYEEYHTNSIPGAVSVPGAELVYRFQGLVPSPETLVVVNCGGRTRSIIGAQALISAGVPNRVCTLQNGTMGWHLGGYEVVRGATRKPPAVSPEQRATARARAEQLAAVAGVTTIDAATLRSFRQQAGEHTLHVLDVRDPDETGEIPGVVAVAGGQLIQETDNWIASRHARIVLLDDAGVRSRITAWWLRQMGFPNVYVLDGDPAAAAGETAGAPRSGDFPLAGPEPEPIAPQALAEQQKTSPPVVIDVGLSKQHRSGHVPGAWHAIRARLAANQAQLPEGATIVVTSEDGVLARFAAAELAALTGRKVGFLQGGTRAWAAAGQPLERDMTRCLDDPDDVWYPPRERPGDRERWMNEYLAWEIDLVNQVRADDQFGFHLSLLRVAAGAAARH